MKRLYLFLLLLIFTAGNADADGKRIALLVGNKNYALHKLDLKNPHNDIARLAAAFEKVGFEVTTVKDASLGKLQVALRRYTRRLRKAGPGAIGFLYYSGHGALNEETRTNYLIPVDVVNIDSEELWDSSVRLRRILDELKSQSRNAQHFVVFDACRNSLQLANKTSKSLLQSKGFKAEREVRGMLISYATAEGKVASDAGDDVGPYATALAAEIVKPGIEAITMFRNVQLSVQDAIGQEPWLTYGALRKTYFAGKDTVQSAKPVVTSKPPLSPEAEAWAAIKDLDSPAVFEAFIERFPKGFYAEFARARLQELKAQAVAKLPETDSLPPLTEPTIPTVDLNELTRQLQTELKRVGCDPGKIDGEWGAKGREAIAQLNLHAKLALAADEPRQITIDAIKSIQKRVCPAVEAPLPVNKQPTKKVERQKTKTKKACVTFSSCMSSCLTGEDGNANYSICMPTCSSLPPC